ncbi:MAG: GntR family transcriptional regulator, partial [Anaerolineales bacterium]|nr:GntR family transcriptional regulator [Anaerolineales bacterium]
NRGFTVAEISFKEQDNLFELRTVLEIYAIDKAVDLISDEDLARMREILPFTDSPDGKLSEKTIRENNYEFHMIPIRAINNSHLTRIVKNLWDLLWIYQLRSEDKETEKNASIKVLAEHTKILESLENRDKDSARKAVANHLDRLKAEFNEHKKIR